MNDRSSWGALVLLCCLRGSEIGIYREISKAGRPALLGLMLPGELTCGSAGNGLPGMCHAVFFSAGALAASKYTREKRAVSALGGLSHISLTRSYVHIIYVSNYIDSHVEVVAQLDRRAFPVRCTISFLSSSGQYKPSMFSNSKQIYKMHV